jgi:hypothetical protein
MKKEYHVKKIRILLHHFSLCCLLIALMSSSAWAKNFTLAWDPSEDPNAAGYYIYYKADTPHGKFDGTGAAEGSSPIDVGRSLTATINDLDERVYFFAVTAYDNFGNESAFSNVMASHWDPVRFPADAVIHPTKSIEFAWETPLSAKPIVSYTLVYGTDLDAIRASVASQFNPGTTLLAGMGLLGLFGLGMNSRKLCRYLPLTALCFLFLMSGCGDGGSDSSWSGLEGSGLHENANVKVVRDIHTTSKTVQNLQPNTTYYWQVIAIDTDGTEQESSIYSFTTGSF